MADLVLLYVLSNFLIFHCHTSRCYAYIYQLTYSVCTPYEATKRHVLSIFNKVAPSQNSLLSGIQLYLERPPWCHYGGYFQVLFM